MYIESDFKNVGALLNGERFFIIPRFQRPYTWSEAKVDEFWNDTVVENPKSDYFIGSLVLYNHGKQEVGVVDGQQRLTTITLILCALRDAFTAVGEDDAASGISRLIERPDLENHNRAVLTSESTRAFLAASIQKLVGTKEVAAKSVEEKNLLSTFKYLSGKITAEIEAIEASPSLPQGKKDAKKGLRLREIRDAILMTKAVSLNLDNDVDAYTIFETLNTRGEQLELSDLVRTHLTRVIPQGNRTVDQVRDDFDAIRLSFGNANRKLDDYIQHFWLSRYNYTAKKKIYGFLKQRVKKSNGRKFFDDFKADSETYLDMVQPSRKKWTREEEAIARSLKAIQLFKLDQPSPFLLAVLRAQRDGVIKKAVVKRAVGAVEAFHFFFTAVTSSRGSGGIAQMYASHASRIASCTSAEKVAKEVDNLRAKLIQKRPTEGEFLADFQELRASEKMSRQKPLVSYILHKITAAESSISYARDSMSIEHLGSQSGKGHSLTADQVSEIGNLHWIDEPAQNALGNKDVVKKVEILESKKYWIDDTLHDKASTWGAAAVRERTVRLGRLAYAKVWKI